MENANITRSFVNYSRILLVFGPILQVTEFTAVNSSFIFLHVDASLTAPGSTYETWNHNVKSARHVVHLAWSFDHTEPGAITPFILTAAPNSKSEEAGCNPTEWLEALVDAANAALDKKKVSVPAFLNVYCHVTSAYICTLTASSSDPTATQKYLKYRGEVGMMTSSTKTVLHSYLLIHTSSAIYIRSADH